jgi:hypothetical protein
MGQQTSPIEDKTRIAGVLSNRQSYSNYGKRKRKAAIAPSIAKPSGIPATRQLGTQLWSTSDSAIYHSSRLP